MHEWTGKGAIQTDEQAVNFILGNAEETKGMTYQQIQEKPKRFIATDSLFQDLMHHLHQRWR